MKGKIAILFYKKNKIKFYLFLVITYFLILLYGGFNNYSIIPYWDMWDGYLGFASAFNNALLESNFTKAFNLLFSQHNEHRILIARLLFLIDYNLFAAKSIFLNAFNYFLLVCLLICFVHLIYKEYKKRLNTSNWSSILILIIILNFSWVQYENLNWGFQSQFFLVFLIPLICFIYFSKIWVDKQFTINKIILLFILGLLSSLCMINGVIVLPLITIFCLLNLNSNKKLFAVNLFGSLLIIFLYFYNFHFIASHSNISSSIFTNFFNVFIYACTYLGSLFFHLFFKNNFSLYLSTIVGLICLSLFSFTLLKTYKNVISNYKQLALSFFIIFIITSSFLTAIGRVDFGIYQAVSSRYSTPSVLFFASLLTFYFPSITLLAKRYSVINFILILIIVFLYIYQFTALKNSTKDNFRKYDSALSLSLGIEDQPILNIAVSSSHALKFMEDIKKNNKSYYSIDLFKELMNYNYYMIIPLKQPLNNAQCNIKFEDESFNSLLFSASIIKLSGFISSSNFLFSNKIKSAYLLNNKNQVIGKGLVWNNNLKLYTIDESIDKNNVSLYSGNNLCSIIN